MKRILTIALALLCALAAACGGAPQQDAAEPTTQEIARTVDIVREAGITALFVEPQYPDRAAETIARETGASLYTLDPIVTGELSGDAYEEKMRQNAATLLEALGS